MTSPSFLRRSLLRVARRFAPGSAALLSLLAVTPDAAAWPNYPGYIQNVLKMDCAPSCLLCHTDPEGGKDTVKGLGLTTEIPPNAGVGVFVQNLIVMQSMTDPISGPQATNPGESAMAAAIQGLRTLPCNTGGTEPCDSDGDGTLDVVELEANQDPDTPGADSLCIGPRYGCGARVAPEAPRSSDATAFLAALGVALVLLRRLRG
jgi:MYXO-CTERM domain-containing protein